jgi:hypothetical protein
MWGSTSSHSLTMVCLPKQWELDEEEDTEIMWEEAGKLYSNAVNRIKENGTPGFWLWNFCSLKRRSDAKACFLPGGNLLLDFEPEHCTHIITHDSAEGSTVFAPSPQLWHHARRTQDFSPKLQSCRSTSCMNWTRMTGSSTSSPQPGSMHA